MIYDGGLSKEAGEHKARFDVCIGCTGVRGVGLFDEEGITSRRYSTGNHQGA